MIVDASVALKGFLDEPLQSEARALIPREDRTGPDIIVAEVSNGLRKAVRDRRMTLPLARDTMRKVDLAIPTIVPSMLVADSAVDISIELINDCIYPAQAVEMESQMVTADALFHDAITRSKRAPCIVLLSAIT